MADACLTDDLVSKKHVSNWKFVNGSSHSAYKIVGIAGTEEVTLTIDTVA